MTATATPPAPSPTPAPPPRRRLRPSTLFAAAVAVIGLHVVDDNFLQPPDGLSAADHLVSGLVPLALLGVAIWAFPRLRAGAQGALALFLGLLGVVAGIEAWHYTSTVGASGDDFTGLLAIPAGLLLVGLGTVVLWRSRRRGGSRARRIALRTVEGVAGVFVLLLVVMPIGLGYVTTHTARSVVPPNHLGVPHEDVRFTTADGLELEGWYVPSRNGAAVIAFPGRNGPQKPARMLARHGYGVLLFDRRGEGRSEGAPNSWGWGGSQDIEAAVAYLEGRPDVDPDRIGGIGLSVGGEMMIETAAKSGVLDAVVSEGAGARTYGEDVDQDGNIVDAVLGRPLSAIKTASIAVFSNTSPPEHLADLAPRVAPRPLLLIAAPNSPHGEELNRDYFAAAREPKELWEIPESGHTGGLAARPEEYERRVVGFFDEALR